MLNDLKTFLSDLKAADLKDLDAVMKWIGKYEPVHLAADELEAAIESGPAYRNWLRTHTDRRVTQGIDTWKGGHLQQEIDDAVAKANPKETDDKRAIRDLQQREKDRTRREKDLRQENLALRHARKMGLPAELVTLLIGDDDDATLANLKMLKEGIEAEVTKQVDEEVKKRFKDNGSDHDAGPDKSKGGGVNPFEMETWSLTEQGQLVKNNPKKARALAAEAGVSLAGIL